MITVSPPPQPVAATAVSAALTDANVQVNSGFRGAQIVLYGAVFDPQQRASDIVVVVRGPEEPVRIARKVRVAGLWLNSRPVVFHGAPGFYMTASTRPLDQITDFGTLRRLGLGLDHLAINAPTEQTTETRYGVRDVVVSRLGADYFDWRRAVVRLKAKAQLYNADDHGVGYVDTNLFRAEIELPASAPTGAYDAEIHLFQDGREVSGRTLPLTVEKVGAERALYLFAHKHSWLYGVVSVMIAVFTGWLASVVFRRT